MAVFIEGTEVLAAGEMLSMRGAIADKSCLAGWGKFALLAVLMRMQLLFIAMTGAAKRTPGLRQSIL
ncbi:MAG: hypothetical protein OSB29_01280 [Verrucomicrobiota bacterium]|nr:hypothetical protein [Verrucomicrobiota bacterium]